MTQKDKELLLKDLCARLPYETLVYAQNANDWYDDEISTQVLSDAINEDYVIKPYLFPLSSMTEEQYEELWKELDKDRRETLDRANTGQKCANPYTNVTDWYNKNHFDYRGLIEKGLAIDATGLNIY